MAEGNEPRPFSIQEFSIDATTSGSGKIEFSNLNPSNAVLLPGAINTGYNNVCLVPVHINNNWAYQVTDGSDRIINTQIKGVGFYILR